MGAAQDSHPQPDSPAPTQSSLYFDKPCPSPYSQRWQVVVRRENHGEAVVSAWGDSAEDATKRAHVAAAAQDMLKQLRWAVLKLEQLKSVAGHLWDADAYRECCRVIDDAMLAARKGGVA